MIIGFAMPVIDLLVKVKSRLKGFLSILKLIKPHIELPDVGKTTFCSQQVARAYGITTGCNTSQHVVSRTMSWL